MDTGTFLYDIISALIVSVLLMVMLFVCFIFSLSEKNIQSKRKGSNLKSAIKDFLFGVIFTSIFISPVLLREFMEHESNSNTAYVWAGMAIIMGLLNIPISSYEKYRVENRP